jgi:rRNA-processing protein FCF1
LKKIILDTNFLLIPAQFRVDIFSEIERIADFNYDLCVLDKTIDELKKIMDEQEGKNKAAAKLALDLVKIKKLKILKTEEGYVDDLLQEQKEAIIATADQELIRKLKDKGIKIIRLRQKKYLKLE